MPSLALLLALVAAAPPVILVTVDGVRPAEVFHGVDGRLAGPGLDDGAPLMPRLQARAARQGFLAGDAARGDPFLVRNAAACSLPGYQSIAVGGDGGCPDNHCGRVRQETVLERARRELGLGAAEVAVVAGWPEVALAAERTEGQLTISVGFQPLRHPEAPPDAALEALAAAAAVDAPPWPYRRDRHTWALAMRYLELHRPRLLWIALGDADELAHLGDYRAYAAAVRDLDERLDALLERLAGMGAYGEGASVLVTTDHGRGEGDAWSAHGPELPGSEQAWLFATTPATRAGPGRAGGGRLDHGSIRPTVEALLGLAPCDACQAPAGALLPPASTAQAGDPAAGAGGP